METFVHVVDAGSFSAAARQLRVQQPAVSKSIAQLEEWLGVRLLLRSTRAVAPTDAGLRFYERCKAALDLAEEAAQAARVSTAALRGRLRIATCGSFARLYLMPRLPEFLARHPELELDALLEDRDFDLVDERVDVALLEGGGGTSSSTARTIAQGRRVVVASAAYLDARGAPATPAQLVEHELVRYARDPVEAGWVFRQGAREERVAVRGRLRVSAAEALREAVLGGIGIGIGCESLFAPDLRAGTLREVLADWQLPPITMSAIFPSGRLASASAREFVAFVENCLAGAGDLAGPAAAVRLAG